jgi:hypothetical protein
MNRKSRTVIINGKLGGFQTIPTIPFPYTAAGVAVEEKRDVHWASL